VVLAAGFAAVCRVRTDALRCVAPRPHAPMTSRRRPATSRAARRR
jgi:hypothetical protein